ncbi:MAG: CHC2 zinc finger domain-containing protein [Myxococcota bacterium]|nr:CHC2 zinc finger domain-containing protein [Myxococcota bacterium]
MTHKPEVKEYYRIITGIDIGIIGQNLLQDRITHTSSHRMECDCPNHNSDSHRSLHIMLDKQGWYCFGCGIGGDVLQLVEFIQSGVVTKGQRGPMPDSHRRARDYLADKVGLPPLSGAVHTVEQLEEIEQENSKNRAAQEAMTALAKFYCARLKANADVLAWFKDKYAITNETIDKLQIGYADNGPGLDAYGEPCDSAVQAMKQSPAKIGVAELFLSSTFNVSKSCALVPFFQKRIVFPYWSRGHVVFMIGRKTPWTPDNTFEAPKYKKLSVYHKEKRPHVASAVHNGYFYNEDCLLSRPMQVLITEGVTDCISAMQCGITTISPATTAFRKDDISRLVRLLKNVDQVIICNDSEESNVGEKGALKTAQALYNAGVAVRIATIPRPAGKDKIDVNELVATQGEKALEDIIKTATSYIKYLIEKIPPTIDKAELHRHLAPILAHLASTEPIARQSYMEEIGTRFNVQKSALKEYLKKASSQEKGLRGIEYRESESTCPSIRINGRQLIDIVKETAGILCASNQARIQAAASGTNDPDGIPIVFSRCGCLVRLKKEDNYPLSIVQANQDVVLAIMARIANWFCKYDPKTITSVFPPRDVARDLITFVPQDLPVLESVITTPIFGSEGDLIINPGYHELDRIWMQPEPGLTLPQIPMTPSHHQVEAAKVLILNDLFVDFPFVDQADQTGIVAALFLPFVRRLIFGPTPIHLIEAPTPGTGKTMLCDLISIIATGQSCQAQTLPTDEEEIRKKLTSELFRAQPIILLDNAKGRRIIDSSTLAAISTCGIWTDRLLGQSTMLSLKNLALWVLTANNPQLSNELTRRCIRIRLDPKEDRPWQRTGFKHDPLVEWAFENRARLLHAVLTLIQAWVSEAMPLGAQRLGSFEKWAAVMDGIFQVLRIPGFLGNLDAFYADADNEGQMWREFTTAWWARFGPDLKRVSDLNNLAEQLDLMQIVRGDGTERAQQIRLGKALQNIRDRVYGDLCVQLVKDRGIHKGRYYALKRMNEPVSEVVSGVNKGGFNPVRAETNEEVDPFCEY